MTEYITPSTAEFSRYNWFEKIIYRLIIDYNDNTITTKSIFLYESKAKIQKYVFESNTFNSNKDSFDKLRILLNYDSINMFQNFLPKDKYIEIGYRDGWYIDYIIQYGSTSINGTLGVIYENNPLEQALKYLHSEFSFIKGLEHF